MHVSGDLLRSLFLRVLFSTQFLFPFHNVRLLACDPVTLHYLRTVTLCVARSCCRACLLLLSHIASCQKVKGSTAKIVIRADVD